MKPAHAEQALEYAQKVFGGTHWAEWIVHSRSGASVRFDSRETGHPNWSEELRYAITYHEIPRTGTSYEMELPLAMTEEPEMWDTVWFPNELEPEWAEASKWEGSEIDVRCLERGVVYATKEDAAAVAKASVRHNFEQEGKG